MTFPLLRLPLLASIEVIKNTDVKYLITLIQLSTRAKNLVKLSKVHIKLTVEENSIQFQKLADQGWGQELKFSDLSEKVTDIPFKPPYHLKFDRRTQYQMGAYKKMLDESVEFFIVRSVSFELEYFCSRISFRYVKLAKEMGLNISRIVLRGSNHRCNSWFTVDHMCALLNFPEVSVKDLAWSNEDLNRFLKFWITCDGRLQSLVSWELDWQDTRINSRVVMNGIDHRVIGHETFEIQRADGVKAKVECYWSSCTLKVINA